MTILNDLDKKITQMGRSPEQKAKENEAQRISQYYRQIGKLFAESLDPKSIPEQYRALYDSIEEWKTKIQELEAFQASPQNGMACPNCHAQIPAGSVFCNACGANLAHTTANTPFPQSQNPESVCAACGAPLNPEQTFCINCGAKIEQPSKPEAKQESGQKEAQEQEQKAETGCDQDDEDMTEIITSDADELSQALQDKPETCPTCGAERTEGRMFCTHCGHKFE